MTEQRIWESDDAYPTVARFDDRRVIRCKNDMQWILQQRKRSGDGWRDLGYFRNKDVLVDRIGKADMLALAIISALPALESIVTTVSAVREPPSSLPVVEAPPEASPADTVSYGFGKAGDPPLAGDDYQLDFYEDGYPKLPACLDRRRKWKLFNEELEAA